jgi:hypothetical protein
MEPIEELEPYCEKDEDEMWRATGEWYGGGIGL